MNKVFVPKNFLVIFVLLFIDSFQVASDFQVNLTNLHIDFEIRCNGRSMDNSFCCVSFVHAENSYVFCFQQQIWHFFEYNFCLEDFLLIQITFTIVNAELHNFLVGKSSKQLKDGKLYYAGFVHAGNSFFLLLTTYLAFL